ncbi:Uncharacterised protein [Vibrio cholerae]|nr:Uncharacterised protein [Vibrio cholerae]
MANSFFTSSSSFSSAGKRRVLLTSRVIKRLSTQPVRPRSSAIWL